MVKQKLDLATAHQAATEIAHLLSDSCERIKIAGSIRREKPRTGDIELVAIPRIEQIESPQQHFISHEKENSIKTLNNFLWQRLENLEADGEINRGSRWGPRYRQFTWKEIQVDLFTATRDNWGLILLLRTGPAGFSRDYGATLRRHGFRARKGQVVKLADSTPIPVATEIAAFRLIRTRYIIANDRKAGMLLE